MKKRRIIPFWLFPHHWMTSDPLKYAEAEARYYYDGEELQRKLADIRCEGDAAARKKEHLLIDLHHEKIDEFTYAMECLKVDGLLEDKRRVAELEFQYRKIDEYEFSKRILELDEPEGVERELKLLELEKKFERINEREYEKKLATLKEEPWIGVINDGFDLNQGINGLFIELDWNDFWIEYLQLNGYTGETQEDIVEAWFADVNRATFASMEPDDRFVTNRRV
jgi:hypothetical protein